MNKNLYSDSGWQLFYNQLVSGEDFTGKIFSANLLTYPKTCHPERSEGSHSLKTILIKRLIMCVLQNVVISSDSEESFVPFRELITNLCKKYSILLLITDAH
jgi:hypothetical protein